MSIPRFSSLIVIQEHLYIQILRSKHYYCRLQAITGGSEPYGCLFAVPAIFQMELAILVYLLDGRRFTVLLHQYGFCLPDAILTGKNAALPGLLQVPLSFCYSDNIYPPVDLA